MSILGGEFAPDILTLRAWLSEKWPMSPAGHERRLFLFLAFLA